MSFAALMNDDQRTMLASIEEFARDAVAPVVEECEHTGAIAPEILDELAALGLFAAAVPEERGGAGAGFLLHAAAVHALATAHAAPAALLVAQGIGIEALLQSAAGEALLDAALQGKALLAPALAAGKASATLVRDGTNLRVSGHFACVPFAGMAAVYVLEVREHHESVLLLLSADARGVKHTKARESLGMHGLALGELNLQDAAVTLLAAGANAQRVSSGARTAVAALLSGVAQGASAHARHYASEREQFGHTIINFGGVQQRLARADALAAAMTALSACAAAAHGNGDDARCAWQARAFAASEGMRAADDCLQVFGGFGLSREYPAERYLRDACFPGFGEYDTAAADAALNGV